jgi:hypothetical protein
MPGSTDYPVTTARIKTRTWLAYRRALRYHAVYTAIQLCGEGLCGGLR